MVNSQTLCKLFAQVTLWKLQPCRTHKLPVFPWSSPTRMVWEQEAHSRFSKLLSGLAVRVHSEPRIWWFRTVRCASTEDLGGLNSWGEGWLPTTPGPTRVPSTPSPAAHQALSQVHVQCVSWAFQVSPSLLFPPSDGLSVHGATQGLASQAPVTGLPPKGVVRREHGGKRAGPHPVDGADFHGRALAFGPGPQDLSPPPPSVEGGPSL